MQPAVLSSARWKHAGRVRKLGSIILLQRVRRAVQQSIQQSVSTVARMGKLDFKDPVPTDIEIAQSVQTVPISRIADQLGIPAQHLEPYGTTKAKARGQCTAGTR